MERGQCLSSRTTEEQPWQPNRSHAWSTCQVPRESLRSVLFSSFTGQEMDLGSATCLSECRAEAGFDCQLVASETTSALRPWHM